ncbi:hypothetical protein NPIL_259481 [Nephila pilipes]|uniref:Uncharacterized protein n=1 Tax=Nephila pilipes TaxID=299642 RepID=A0A8X6NHU2_NEPPI|nr:hypothetical protein NPIL_259481 [Nephila pilipes]
MLFYHFSLNVLLIWLFINAALKNHGSLTRVILGIVQNDEDETCEYKPPPKNFRITNWENLRFKYLTSMTRGPHDWNHHCDESNLSCGKPVMRLYGACFCAHVCFCAARVSKHALQRCRAAAAQQCARFAARQSVAFGSAGALAAVVAYAAPRARKGGSQPLSGA